MQALKTRLETIVAGATYSFTPSAVLRPTRLSLVTTAPVDKLVYLEQGDPQPDDQEYLDGSIPRRCWVLPVDATVWCLAVESSTTPVSQTCNEREADLITAFMTDPTLGGLAMPTSTHGAPQGMVSSDGVFEGVTVPFEIHYRVSDLDPRIQG